MICRESKVVCITGMGRSGSSLIANLINSMGVYFGHPENLVGYEPTEHRRFREINSAILQRFGGFYDKPPSILLQHDWKSMACLKDLKDEALSLISQEFRDAGVWGWKAPSTTLVLPFWQSLIPHMSYVICIRNPIDVALSYKKFRHFPFSKTINLWLLYNAIALRDTKNKKRLFLLYEDLFTKKEYGLYTLEKFVYSNNTTDEVFSNVRNLLRPELWHNRSTVEDVFSSGRIPIIAKTLYIFLKTISSFEYIEQKEYSCIIDEISDFFFENVKKSHYRRINSTKIYLIKYIELLMKPIIPGKAKDRLIALRDRIIWS